MTKIFTFIICIFFVINLSAQTVVDTVSLSSGKTIIIYSNGTWKENVIEKPLNENTFIDSRDGKVYKTITIGNQTWMAENLSFKTDNGCWAYNNDTSYVSTYGYLYNWETAKNVCPIGWHLPSEAEWKVLEKSFSGGKLKETGIAHWNSPNAGATNESGFTALPSGYRIADGTFNLINNHSFWWTSSELKDISRAIQFGLTYDGNYVSSGNSPKTNGFSVRCVKDK